MTQIEVARKYLNNGAYSMNIVALPIELKDETERIAAGTWGGTYVAVHGELYDLRELPCYIAFANKQKVLGYCYYRFDGNECEIMAIESVTPGKGVGTALINAVITKAKSKKCKRVFVNTSNDNTHALRFYQRRGFTMCAVRWNEFDYLRIIKPTIPLIGDDNIPLLHEIELEITNNY
jgi:GNAT superfamily N-acetyltransferase